MAVNALDELRDLHTHFNLLRGADSALLKANNFDTKLNHLGHLVDELERQRETYFNLTSIDGALEMLLELLHAAHAEKLYSDHLHCLMEPLRGKLYRALNEMEAII
ncbi:DUF1484 family protein [Metapseudomonas furukawaii]|uniref:DUF1484 family protein n=1 Tax=Metapseudomonas furukawaii TaxID=1149133 RepID=A0AAD1C055_METFU|nr:DUF1484 family protein [Pseudomonas furukawaii]ELS26652.1 hypothetical protein ppKF707_3070 [Pseudomonas furukawaii]BAU74390.1 hypothetical protein KF707C_27020 [Pseudomonas furukawaii]